jgi:peptidoglycan/xylan/chitin deacetylase (PgdA/CDA1 family)
MTPIALPHGTFVLSVDTELMWGSLHRVSATEFEDRHGTLRETVRDLLDVLDETDIAATWAVVGHLLLERCERGEDGRAHGDLRRPNYGWHAGDWYDADPCTDVERDPLWYAPDIVTAIRHRDAGHELASHSFGHVVYGDPGCPPEAAADDLRAWNAAAAEIGITGTSFVFPRNRIGHLDLLAEAGFRSFRGHRALTSRAARVAEAAAAIAGRPVKVGHPKLTASGLVEIPGSMPLLPPKGRLSSRISMRARVKTAVTSIDHAVRARALFHLWLHPMDLAQESPERIDALHGVLEAVSRQRAAGDVVSMTMAQVAGASAAEGHV